MLISKTARKYPLNTQYVLSNERQKLTTPKTATPRVPDSVLVGRYIKEPESSSSWVDVHRWISKECELWCHNKLCFLSWWEQEMLMKSRVVDIVSLKFTSDEAAGWKVDILETLFTLLCLICLYWNWHAQNEKNTTAILLELRLLSRFKTRKEVCT